MWETLSHIVHPPRWPLNMCGIQVPPECLSTPEIWKGSHARSMRWPEMDGWLERHYGRVSPMQAVPVRPSSCASPSSIMMSFTSPSCNCLVQLRLASTRSSTMSSWIHCFFLVDLVLGSSRGDSGSTWPVAVLYPVYHPVPSCVAWLPRYSERRCSCSTSTCLMHRVWRTNPRFI